MGKIFIYALKQGFHCIGCHAIHKQAYLTASNGGTIYWIWPKSAKEIEITGRISLTSLNIKYPAW